MLGIKPVANRIYEDVQGGDESDRPEYQGLIEQVRTDALTGLKVLIVITDQSRLSREGVDKVANLIELFDALGVVIFALDGGLLTVADPTQRLAVGSKALFHDYFLREHRQKLRSAKAQRRLEGKPINPNPPAGYKWSREKFLRDYDLWAIARSLVEKYLPPPMGEGVSLGKVAEQAIAVDFPVKTAHGIKRWLINPVLRGHLENFEEGWSRKAQKNKIKPKAKRILHNCHEALISESEYDAILLRLKENKTYARRGTDAPRYPLSGLVFCGGCDHKMSYHTQSDKRWGRYGNYVCINASCDRFRASISERKIEAIVKQALASRAVELATMASLPVEETVNFAALELERQIKELQAMYQKSPLAGLREAIAELEDRLAKSQVQVESNGQNFEGWLEMCEDPNSWDLLTIPEKRIAYHELVEAIVFTKGREILVSLRF